MKHLSLLLAALLIPSAALAAPPKTTGPDAELHKLRAEIAAAKLDQLLNLTKDQAKALLPVLKEGLQVREQLKAEHERRHPEIVKALTAVRDDILKNGAVSEANRKGLQDARGDTALKDAREKAKSLHQKARDILTPEQRERMREFDPRPLGGEGREGFGGDEMEGRGGHHKGMGPKFHKVLKVASSAEFVALVEARAR